MSQKIWLNLNEEKKEDDYDYNDDNCYNGNMNKESLVLAAERYDLTIFECIINYKHISYMNEINQWNLDNNSNDLDKGKMEFYTQSNILLYY